MMIIILIIIHLPAHCCGVSWPHELQRPASGKISRVCLETTGKLRFCFNAFLFCYFALYSGNNDTSSVDRLKLRCRPIPGRSVQSGHKVDMTQQIILQHSGQMHMTCQYNNNTKMSKISIMSRVTTLQTMKFPDDSLTVRSTRHVKCYSYHACTSVTVSGGGRNATVHVLVLLSVVGVAMQQCMIQNHIFNI